MSRLLVHVEGQTEEQFVQQVLAPYLIGRGYSSVSPRMVGNTRQRHGRGGIKNWMSVRKEILKHLREDRASIATTMVDYYGLPYTWPGRKQANALKAVEQKASALEKAILEDISSGLGGLDPRRFVPYVRCTSSRDYCSAIRSNSQAALTESIYWHTSKLFAMVSRRPRRLMTLLTLLQASELESFTGGKARSLMGMPPSSKLVSRPCLGNARFSEAG